MIDERILKFIRKMHLLSLAVLVGENDGEQTALRPYCASCFYAFDEQNLALIVAGGSSSRHIGAIKNCAEVSGTIALDTKIVGKIEGVQFSGVMGQAGEYERGVYLRRFPYAVAMKPEIYAIRLTWLKFTHNTLGFGKKIEWKRNVV